MLSEAVRAGILHFNAGRYFDAHEAWEEHWGLGDPAERKLLLGLIKAAVALHHLNARNAAGFLWQAQEAIKHLKANADVWPELRLAELAEEMESLVAQLRFHGENASFELPRLPDP